MAMSYPQARNRPQEVDISFWLWISAFALGVLGSVFAYQQVAAAQDEALRRALAENPAADPATAERIVSVGIGAGIAFGLAIVAAEVVFMFLMRGGRNWARIVLTVFGALSIVGGLIGLFANSGLQLVAGLFQLLLVIGATVYMYRPAANAYFQPRPAGF